MVVTQLKTLRFVNVLKTLLKTYNNVIIRRLNYVKIAIFLRYNNVFLICYKKRPDNVNFKYA